MSLAFLWVCHRAQEEPEISYEISTVEELPEGVVIVESKKVCILIFAVSRCHSIVEDTREHLRQAQCQRGCTA